LPDCHRGCIRFERELKTREVKAQLRVMSARTERDSADESAGDEQARKPFEIHFESPRKLAFGPYS